MELLQGYEDNVTGNSGRDRKSRLRSQIRDRFEQMFLICPGEDNSTIHYVSYGDLPMKNLLFLFIFLLTPAAVYPHEVCWARTQRRGASLT